MVTKKKAFANLKKEAKSSNKKIKKMKRKLNYARKHWKKKGSATAPLVTSVSTFISTRIIGAAIHILSKVDALCLKIKMYRMLPVRR